MNSPRRSLACCCWVLFASALLVGCRSIKPATATASVQNVQWKSIGHGVVIIGKLGLPLGVTTEIEATIVSGPQVAPEAKSLQSSYFLQVHKVGETELPTPQLEFFTLLHPDLPLATNPFELYELKNGKKIGHLSQQEIEELEKKYLGQRFRLLVFEEGEFEFWDPETLTQIREEPGLRMEEWTSFRPRIKIIRIIPDVWPSPDTDLFKTLRTQCVQVAARIKISPEELESVAREAAKQHRRMVAWVQMDSSDSAAIALGLADSPTAEHGIAIKCTTAGGRLIRGATPEFLW